MANLFSCDVIPRERHALYPVYSLSKAIDDCGGDKTSHARADPRFSMKRPPFLWLFFATLLFGPAALEAQSTAAAASPRVFSLSRSGLAEVKARIAQNDPDIQVALRRLLREADQAMDVGPYSVVLKSHTPPSGNKHDYTSVNPYTWPDPSKPDGLPYIRRDGYTNPEWWQDFDRVPFERLAQSAEALALAYTLTGKETYASRAAHLIRIWFLDPDTAMNPDLEFSQIVPGVSTGFAQVIDTRFMPRIVDSIGLLSGSKAWTEKDQRGMVSWFSKFVPNVRARADKEYRDHPHNIASFYHAQMASMALFIGDDAQAKELIERTYFRLDKAVEADGFFFRERRRTRSLSYSSFHLFALYNLATMGRFVGIDIWNFKTPDGRGLRLALDTVAAHAGPYPPASWPLSETGKTPGDWWDPYHDQLSVVLYQAAIAYRENSYEKQAAKIVGSKEAMTENLVYLLCGLQLPGQQSMSGWLFHPSSVDPDAK